MIRNTYSPLLLLSLVVILVALALLSAQFDYELAFSSLWTSINVILMMSAGIIFLLLAYSFRKKPLNTKSVYAIVLVGLGLRILFVPSQPILEDDFYRYFFDGSLITHAQNPYKQKPADAYPQKIKGIVEDTVIEAKPELQYLHHFSHFSRVAYPHIKTIYPLTAQAVFAFSAKLQEFNLTVWRCVLIGIELISLLILIKLLSVMQLSKAWVGVYWLNPLVITEGINAAHMDVILVPFLLLTLLCLQFKKYKFASVSISLAVGVKIWPLLLVPLLAVFIKKQQGNVITFLLLTFLFSFTLFLPQLAAIDADAGVVKYAQLWQVNSFLFNILYTPLNWLSNGVDFIVINAGWLARLISALVIVVSALFLSWRLLVATNKTTISQLSEYALWTTLILFLLSPTGYPWYCFWFFPFLPFVLNPRTWPVLWLVVTLPLYDLRYIAQGSDNELVWQWLLVTVTFLPVIIGLVLTNWVGFQKGDAKTQLS